VNLGKLFGTSYPKVNVREAARLLDDGAVLLDVRDPHEWQAGHAPKARHLPLAELSRRLGEVPANKPILTICRSGHRSGRAAAILADAGRDVSNVTGGMNAWSRAGFPVVAKGGAPGRVA
jgi:rhodanese-related sulfurtransferase